MDRMDEIDQGMDMQRDKPSDHVVEHQHSGAGGEGTGDFPRLTLADGLGYWRNAASSTGTRGAVLWARKFALARPKTGMIRFYEILLGGDGSVRLG
jgi:hypothetical protein